MLKISEEKVIGLFNELKEETNNFINFDIEIFRRNPQKIIILRLMLNLSQREFSKINKITTSTISKWENLVNKGLPLSKQLAKLIEILKRPDGEFQA